MPQIRCPNCGLTINLENRKDTDMQLITTAVQHNANSFTDLLHTTRLPRKTLSLRLKEMCHNGVLAKAEGVYKLPDISGPEKRIANPFNRFANVVSDRRVKGLIVLGLILVGFPAVSYALAALFQGTPSTNVAFTPKILGNFTALIEVQDVSDLYDWQAVVSFNASELKVLDTMPGAAFAAEYPYFPDPSDLGSGLMLVGASLKGNTPGVSIQGKGTLAVIVFGYYLSDYQRPTILAIGGGFETFLEDSQGNRIPSAPNLSFVP